MISMFFFVLWHFYYSIWLCNAWITIYNLLSASYQGCYRRLWRIIIKQMMTKCAWFLRFRAHWWRLIIFKAEVTNSYIAFVKQNITYRNHFFRGQDDRGSRLQLHSSKVYVPYLSSFRQFMMSSSMWRVLLRCERYFALHYYLSCIALFLD